MMGGEKEPLILYPLFTHQTTHDTIMGFAVKTPKVPATVISEPPVVAETHEPDAVAEHEQRAARRKGLLSTILSDSNRSKGMQAAATNAEQTTLG